jgi:hypothetical protein
VGVVVRLRGLFVPYPLVAEIVEEVASWKLRMAVLYYRQET